MGIVARWAVRRPVIALISWFVTVVIAVGVGLGFGGNLNDSFDLPDTESTVAQEYLGQLPNAGGSSGASVRIVWSPTQGTVLDPAVVDTVTPVLEQISTLSAVECVQSPYPADPANPAGPRATFGTDCPAPADNSAFANLTPEELEQLQPAIESATSVLSPISADGAVAYATVSFPGDGTDVPTEELRTLVADVDAINSPELQVGAIGQILDLATTAPPSSEAIGILVAIIILLIAFGSVVAAGIPIAVALFGLAVGQMLVLVVARFMDVATFAPTLAAMIGLGVGIDYALFVLNRYRQAVLVGHDPKRAAMEAVNTAGRAVQFAGITVIFALLGLFVLGIGYSRRCCHCWGVRPLPCACPGQARSAWRPSLTKRVSTSSVTAISFSAAPSFLRWWLWASSWCWQSRCYHYVWVSPMKVVEQRGARSGLPMISTPKASVRARMARSLRRWSCQSPVMPRLLPPRSPTWPTPPALPARFLPWRCCHWC